MGLWYAGYVNDVTRTVLRWNTLKASQGAGKQNYFNGVTRGSNKQDYVNDVTKGYRTQITKMTLQGALVRRISLMASQRLS
jgi:hypothetical protein